MNWPERKDRRAFLGDLGRLLVAGGLGAGALYLASRGTDCDLPGACQGCPSFARCDLPMAADERAERVRRLG